MGLGDGCELQAEFGEDGMAQGFDESLEFIDDREVVCRYHDCADFDGFHLVAGDALEIAAGGFEIDDEDVFVFVEVEFGQVDVGLFDGLGSIESIAC